MKRLVIALAIGALTVGTSSFAFAQEAKAAQEHPAVHPDGAHPGGPGGRPGPGPVRPEPNPGRPGGDPGRGPGGDHPHPIPVGPGGDHPHPGPGGGPDRWHGPEHTWGGWGAWNVFHGPWFWYGDSIALVWDGVEYIQTPVYYDPDSGMYYWVDADGVSHWLN
jgi:hypothetical protein